MRVYGDLSILFKKGMLYLHKGDYLPSAICTWILGFRLIGLGLGVWGLGFWVRG